MAQIQITQYFCDRCKDEIPDEKIDECRMVQVSGHQDGEWAADWVVDWKELCLLCQKDIAVFFSSHPLRLKQK